MLRRSKAASLSREAHKIALYLERDFCCAEIAALKLLFAQAVKLIQQISARVLTRVLWHTVSVRQFPFPIMKTPPISPSCARATKTSSLLALGLILGYSPFLTAQIAHAQGALAAPATPPANAATLPAAPDINVLILAFDDLSATSDAANAAPAFVPPTPATPPGAVAPIVPADGIPAIVTPTDFGGQLWQWRGAAQKKSKEEKRREREAEEAARFNLNPVAPTPYTPPGRNNPNAAPAVTPPIVGAPNFGAPDLSDAPDAPLPVAPAGRSQLMALPLRRALTARGYKDVQVVTPESPTIMRALGEGRLSSRVLDELKTSLATLAANNAAGVPADVNATIAAGRAASRIGQATGYRAVIGFAVSAPTAIGVVGAGATPDATTQKVSANMIVADAQRESVEPLEFVETGDTPQLWQEAGGVAGAQLLEGTLRDWPATSNANNAALAQIHFGAARAALERGDASRAQDELNQSLSLDSSQPQSFLLRGDILRATDPVAASSAYRKAVELNSTKGEDWARIALAYAYAKTPDWRAAWDAGKRALALNYDSAPLRVAIATAQYGRAELFRNAQYPGQADEAEADARANLERALQIAPDDSTAMRLLARNLLEKRRYSEAITTLDRIAPRYPNDLEIQNQYATVLLNQSGREEDAFAAYSRVWKLSGQKQANVDVPTYRTLATGFDQRLFSLGKVATQLSRGVASRAILRETALIQLSKLKEEMEEAKGSIAIMKPTIGISSASINARIFAADLMDQALESYQTYLDTGQGDYFVRGDGLYRSAVEQLNTARSAQ